MTRTYYEFFAGGGMARAGLGRGWECLFANDFDSKKADVYRLNWGGAELAVSDVATVSAKALPGQADLAWASFPCQDLSLAGDYAGLSGRRSGTFWPFWHVIQQLREEGRAPRAIVLENVYGALTSHGGQDFAAIAQALAAGGYRFGAMVIDARLFVPQSRPRLFIIGIDASVGIPAELAAAEAQSLWHPPALQRAQRLLRDQALHHWVWWNPVAPATRNQSLADVIEPAPTGLEWHSPSETSYLVSMMTPPNRAKLAEAVRQTTRGGAARVGTLYRRTRQGVQRAEVRFDGLAGCLRTPAGGSSRQTLVHVDAGRVRSRLMSGREAARLMGLDDSYQLPNNLNQALHLLGDGVAVPVVRHIASNVLEPVLERSSAHPAASMAAE